MTSYEAAGLALAVLVVLVLVRGRTRTAVEFRGALCPVWKRLGVLDTAPGWDAVATQVVAFGGGASLFAVALSGFDGGAAEALIVFGVVQLVLVGLAVIPVPWVVGFSFWATAVLELWAGPLVGFALGVILGAVFYRYRAIRELRSMRFARRLSFGDTEDARRSWMYPVRVAFLVNAPFVAWMLVG